MRTSLNYLLGLLTTCLVFSCSTSKIMKSELDPNAIQELQVFHPISKIYHINKGNIMDLSDSLSRFSRILLLDIILADENLPVGQEVLAEDRYEQELLDEEVEAFFVKINNTKKKELSQLTVPPMVSHLLRENNKRFGLLTATTGFNRRKGNYGGQVLKSIGIGILTMGFYYPVPIKAHSYVGAIIVDNESNEVAFFRISQVPEIDPMNKSKLSRQLELIFKGYFGEDNNGSSIST